MRDSKFKIAILFYATLCWGGWYECYNFNGTIGKYPINASFQIMDRAFSKSAHYKVIGNYKYKSKNNPILLYGCFDVTNRKMRIYEVKKNLINGVFYNNIDTTHLDSIAVFNFIFDTNTINGSWINLITNQELPLNLNLTAQFKDFSSNDGNSEIPIVQSFSTSDKYFVGEYVYNPHIDERGRMKCLKVYNKRTDTLIQVIDFTEYSVPIGNVSTPIYNNISITHEGFWIWANLGPMGTEVYFTFNSKQNYYEITKEGKNLLSD
jgi:hypothetical protein